MKTTYKHLGANIDRKCTLVKHYKPTVAKVMRAAIALARIRNDSVPPQKYIRLYMIISKATIDYTGPILDIQRESIKTKFRKLSCRALRTVLGMPRSSPISVLHQITGDPEKEWRRRNLYYKLGKERENDKEYNLVEEKKRIKKLRKTLSWPLLRTACISLG